MKLLSNILKNSKANINEADLQVYLSLNKDKASAVVSCVSNVLEASNHHVKDFVCKNTNFVKSLLIYTSNELKIECSIRPTSLTFQLFDKNDEELNISEHTFVGSIEFIQATKEATENMLC